MKLENIFVKIIRIYSIKICIAVSEEFCQLIHTQFKYLLKFNFDFCVCSTLVS